MVTPLDSSNTDPYGYSVSSPFNLPPYDSLAPIPLPENTPPFCEYPPSTPQSPSTILPSPIGGYTPSTPSLPYAPFTPQTPSTSVPSPTGGYTPLPPSLPPSSTPILPIQNPPPSPSEYVPSPNTPEIVPSPPSYIPSPPEYVPSPLIYIPSPPNYEPSPPSYVPSPTTNIPTPPGIVTSPPVFQPPVVFPPPTVPPPPYHGPPTTLWCVAKPSVPDPIIREAMNYACGSGADCDQIQENGSCFEPNTLFAHASYAFNSYWQRTKVAGGTCEFGGTAMLVTVDPSYDGCHFIYN
ncbi:unnamed protein product [Ilex paraguariensis]|uniref:X8 domain-containing protein n=1 Tax=Ilex paraguariensis TaxID=185542 RepID=A0ABC8UF74_9AQUA